MISTIVALWYMIVGHFLADYSLQTDFIAKGKSPNAQPQFVPWYFVMLAHAITHGAMVSIAAGIGISRLHAIFPVVLGIQETLLHFFIDVLKCVGCTSIHVDQALHILCKIAWAISVSLWVANCTGWGTASSWLFSATLGTLILVIGRHHIYKDQCKSEQS
jgi:hypothetical protein